MTTENATVIPIVPGEEGFTELATHLGHIKAIADVVGQLDATSQASDSMSLFKHTIWNLMDAVNSEVDAAKSALNRLGGAS